MSACCFTGHRDINESNISGTLKSIIKDLYARGVTDFYAGGAAGFDTLAAQAVIALKNELPIKLTVVLPYKGFGTHGERKTVLEAADAVVCLSSFRHAMCYYERNRYMVDRSDYCVYYLRKTDGGTAYTYRYAREKGIETIAI